MPAKNRIDDTYLCYNYTKLWTTDDTCGNWYCLTRRQIEFILASLRFGLWSSRWYIDDYGQTKLRDLDPVLLQEATDWVERLNDDLMSDCSVGIQQGLEAMADAIRALATGQGNCDDCGGATVEVNITPDGRTVTGDITTGYGDEEGMSSASPEGFDTWEEYYTHKCQQANAIVDGWISELNTFSMISVLSFVSVSAALGLCWAAFPPSAIVMLVVALVALALARHYLSEVSDAISADRENYVCALYGSRTTGEAIDDFLAMVDDDIDDLALASPIPTQLKQVVNAMADASVFSNLFQVGLDLAYPDADCSACEATQQGHWYFTNGEEGWEYWNAATNPRWSSDQGGHLIADCTGQCSAVMQMYYPVQKFSCDIVKVTCYGILGNLDYIRLFTSPDTSQWTKVAEMLNTTTPGDFTVKQFGSEESPLGITDKYIMITLSEFWTDAFVQVTEVEFA